MKQKYKPIIQFNEPFEEEWADGKILNPKILELQDNIAAVLQYLDSALWDIRGAIEQDDMKSANQYIGNAESNLHDAYATLSDIEIDEVETDVKQLQQQRIMDALKD